MLQWLVEYTSVLDIQVSGTAMLRTRDPAHFSTTIFSERFLGQSESPPGSQEFRIVRIWTKHGRQVEESHEIFELESARSACGLPEVRSHFWYHKVTEDASKSIEDRVHSGSGGRGGDESTIRGIMLTDPRWGTTTSNEPEIKRMTIESGLLIDALVP